MDRTTLGGLTKLWAWYEISAAEPPSALSLDVIGCLSQATHKRPSNRARSGASRWNAMAWLQMVVCALRRDTYGFLMKQNWRGVLDDEGVVK